MKLNARKRTKLAPNNKSLLAKHANDKLVACPYYPLLLLWAEVLDMAANGENVYFIAGTTKDISAATIKVVTPDDAETLYADGLFELASEVVPLLQSAPEAR